LKGKKVKLHYPAINMNKNRFIRMILNNPANIFPIVFWNCRMLILKLLGYKTIIYNIHYDYFFDIFLPVYEKLILDKRIKIYFSWLSTNKILKNHLINMIGKKRLISNIISPYILTDLFITGENNGPDFPFSHFPTRKIQIYHGTGVYTHYRKADVLSRFDIHFAIGPLYIPFINSLPCKGEKNSNLRIVGYPKLDKVIEPDPALVSYLTDLYGINDKFVILYTPHWNEFGSLHVLGLDITKNLSQIAENVVVLIKVHNFLFTEFKEQNWHKKLSDLQNKFRNIKIVSRPNTQEVYPLGDMLITDTGTTAALEYSLTRKPLFVFFNQGWFDHHNNTEVEMDIVNTSITFTTISEIVQYAKEVYTKQPDMMKKLAAQSAKQLILTNNNLFNPGKATNIACQIIIEELGIS